MKRAPSARAPGEQKKKVVLPGIAIQIAVGMFFIFFIFLVRVSPICVYDLVRVSL